MLSSALTVNQVSYGSVTELCEDFVRRSRVRYALLVGQDGLLLHRCGAIDNEDVDSVSALSAGAFASARALARLVGEVEFNFLMQQGRRNHLQLMRAGDSALLVAVFDDHTTAGMVRLLGQRVAQRLARLLAAEEEPSLEARREIARLEPVEEEGEPAAAPGEDRHRLIELAWNSDQKAEQLRGDLRMRTFSLVVAVVAAATAIAGALLHH